MAIVDPWLDRNVLRHLNSLDERIEAIELEDDSESLDDDQLSRLGIENVTPDQTNITLTGMTSNWTIADTVTGLAASHDFPELQVDGQLRTQDALVTGQITIDNDLTVHGFTSIGNMAADTIHTQDAVVGGMNILTELIALRGEMDLMRLEKEEMKEILRRLTEADGQNES